MSKEEKNPVPIVLPKTKTVSQPAAKQSLEIRPGRLAALHQFGASK